LNAAGELVQIVLRERAADASLVPVAREPCGPEIAAALSQLRDGTPDSEFKAAVIAWLERWYRAEATLADAFAGALDALLAAGVVVLRAYATSAKRGAAPWVLKGDSTTRLRTATRPCCSRRARAVTGCSATVTRSDAPQRERFARAEARAPLLSRRRNRLSPNVLLRPWSRRRCFQRVAYAAGPAELQYLQDAAPLYGRSGWRASLRARWSGGDRGGPA